MELKRRIALSAAILSVGLGAGHIVQNMSPKPKAQQASLAADSTPKDITPLAAGATKATPVVQTATAAPSLPSAMPKEPSPVVVKADPAPAPLVPETKPAIAAATETPVAPEAAADPADAVADACAGQFDLAAQPSAMLGLTLIAPCHADERVVLRHGGLAITAKTSATGSVFLELPALEAKAVVSVLFGDGSTVEATLDVPELASLKRFAVQWTADDAFQVHAFEGGADYGASGHVSAATPQLPPAGVPAKGGFLTALGDATVDLPMLAEVYTFPADDPKVDVVVETAVTDATCGRELLGETLTSEGGEVFITDLTVAMPECEAKGDILVLKNLVLDMKLASN